MKRSKAKKNYLLASFLVVAITIAIYSSIDALIVNQKKQELINNVYLVSVTQIPVLKDKLAYEIFAQGVTAKSAYVEDIDTGTILFERNSDRILLPASTTKLMTALVALEEYQTTDVITVPALPRNLGLKYDFKEGEQLTVGDLLKAALIQSSNDAAYILALSSDRGFDGFVNRMNERALELKLKNTKYQNPAGFDTDTQRSSAHDLVILSKEFMKNDFLASVVATKETIVTDVSGEYEHHLANTHQLLGVDPTVVGIKTGTTEGAAQVLITQFVRDGHTILVVVMGSDDRYLETTQLVDWVFEAYEWVNPQDLI
ncbi:D-alanyl-D-alanine carboxypeptidase [Candidatus Woesebacteria bacterium]|nr:D-alanyl-D-alanine carboxypeptidase [Candidatus Woesebacteria bacterium]